LNLSQWAGWNYGWWRKIAMLRMGLLMADEIVYFLRFADLYFRFARDNLNGAGLRKEEPCLVFPDPVSPGVICLSPVWDFLQLHCLRGLRGDGRRR